MWLIEIGLVFIPDNAEEEDPSYFARLLASAHLELTKLDGIAEPDYVATLAARTAEFSVRVDIDEREDASRFSCAAMRTALHHAGASTKGWEDRVDELIARSRVITEFVPA